MYDRRNLKTVTPADAGEQLWKVIREYNGLKIVFDNYKELLAITETEIGREYKIKMEERMAYLERAINDLDEIIKRLE